jgi:hypothetical protein
MMRSAILMLAALVAAGCAAEDPPGTPGGCIEPRARVALAETLRPGALAVDAHDLYFSGHHPDGSALLVRMPKAGGPQRVVVDHAPSALGPLLADAAGLYVADADYVSRFDPANLDQPPTSLITVGVPQAIAWTERGAYYLHDASAFRLEGTRISQYVDSVTLAQGLPGSRSGDLLVDGDLVYLSSASPDAVWTVPLGEGPPAPLTAAGPLALLTAADPASPLSIDGDTLYFAGTDAAGRHGVLAMNKRGGAPALVALATHVVGIAVADGVVWFAATARPPEKAA